MTKKPSLQSEILYKDREKKFHLDFDKIKRNYFLTKRNVKHSSLHTHAFFELELILSGKGEVKNKNDAKRGRIAKINVKYIQFSVPKIRKKTDAIITFVTTPQPYRE